MLARTFPPSSPDFHLPPATAEITAEQIRPPPQHPQNKAQIAVNDDFFREYRTSRPVFCRRAHRWRGGEEGENTEISPISKHRRKVRPHPRAGSLCPPLISLLFCRQGVLFPFSLPANPRKLGGAAALPPSPPPIPRQPPTNRSPQ